MPFRDGSKLPLPFADVRSNDNVATLSTGSTDTIGESLAICRYVEESKVGAGVRLFGCGPLQRAKVEMWTRRVELELLFSSVGKAWYHGPTLAPMRKSSGLTAHDSELQLGMRTAQRFYKEVERELQAKGPFLAGEDFTVAD